MDVDVDVGDHHKHQMWLCLPQRSIGHAAVAAVRREHHVYILHCVLEDFELTNQPPSVQYLSSH